MIDEKDLDKADSMLTKGWLILKKHWGKILIILLVYGLYRFGCAVSAEMDRDAAAGVTVPIEEEVLPTTIDTPSKDSLYVVEEYQEVLKDGTVGIIQVWSDGIETIKKD